MMKWQKRIVVNSKVMVGKPVIKGTRLTVELILDLLARGYTTRQILKQYDHVTAADVQACLAYAAEMLKSERIYPLSS